MRVYIELARRSFAQQFAYREATLAGLFTNSVFGIMLASVFLGLYQSRSGPVAGWSADETVRYVWINQSLLMVLFVWGWWEVAQTIRTGAIVTDLLKPIDYYAYWMARDVGRAGAQLIIRGMPTLAIGWVLFHLQFPTSPVRWVEFLVSIFFAVLVSFAFRFLINLATFWTIDYRGLSYASIVLVNLFSGLLLPLTFFPAWLLTIANLLPFRSLMMLPNEVLAGHRSPWSAYGLQIFWVVALSALAQLVMKRAEKKLVVQGG
jgi:ABC-2 type transport system permease protein